MLTEKLFEKVNSTDSHTSDLRGKRQDQTKYGRSDFWLKYKESLLITVSIAVAVNFLQCYVECLTGTRHEALSLRWRST